MNNTERNLRKKVIAVVAISLIIMTGVLVVSPKTSTNGSNNDPFATGFITYSANTMSPAILSAGTPHAANGTIQAYMPVPGVNASVLANANFPLQAANNSVSLGYSLLSSGKFHLHLNQSFYSAASKWANIYSFFRSNTSESLVMFEINIAIPVGNYTYIYTFVATAHFSPFNVNKDHPPIFNIQKNFILGNPTAIVNNELTGSTGGSGIHSFGISGGGGWTARVITIYEWETYYSHAFLNVPFPLLVTENTTSLNYSRGDYVSSFSLGASNDSIEFTSAQGFTGSSNISNINNWNFQSGTSSTYTTTYGFESQGRGQFPLSPAYMKGHNLSSNESTVVLGLTNLSLNVMKMKLYYMTTTYVYYDGIYQYSTTSSGYTGEMQIQEYLTSTGGPVRGITAYYPSWFATAIQWANHNSTSNSGTLSGGRSLNFYDLTTTLSGSSTDESQTISNAADIAISSLGVMLAIWAGAEAMTLGTAGPVATLAVLVSMTGVVASILALAASVQISAKSVTTFYTSGLTSYYPSSLNTVVTVVPRPIQVDGYSLAAATPLVVLS